MEYPGELHRGISHKDLSFILIRIKNYLFLDYNIIKIHKAFNPKQIIDSKIYDNAAYHLKHDHNKGVRSIYPSQIIESPITKDNM